jgi:SRSO17 transposase
VIFSSIEEYMRMYFPFFRRLEGRELAKCYITGLIMDGERKSVEPMSERVNASERGMQRLLTEVKWDHSRVFEEYRHRMLLETGESQGVLVLDDTSFPKKGEQSVCVSRQYCGALGKISNCQVGVSLTYVGQGVFWPYTMDLYVPKSWDKFEVPESILRREKTGMPEGAHFREKWEIALEQIALAKRDVVPHRCVVADSWYGNVSEFRRRLEEGNEKYVVGIYSDREVFLDSPVFVEPQRKENRRGRPRKYPKLIATNPLPFKVSELGSAIAEDEWEHLELRRNSRGKPLMVEAYSRRVYPAKGYRNGCRHEEVWLIIERRQKDKREFELRYYFSNMPQNMPTLEMIRLMHERFWIEQGYQQLKEELGLDHHEGRSWIGWHRHVLLVFLAFGYLTLQRIHEKKQLIRNIWKQKYQQMKIQEKGLSS